MRVLGPIHARVPASCLVIFPGIHHENKRGSLSLHLPTRLISGPFLLCFMLDAAVRHTQQTNRVVGTVLILINTRGPERVSGSAWKHVNPYCQLTSSQLLEAEKPASKALIGRTAAHP